MYFHFLMQCDGRFAVQLSCNNDIFFQGRWGDRVGVISRLIGGVIEDTNPVITALDAAQQVLDLASEFLVHENVNEWIDGGIARDQNDGRNVGDISVVLWGTEVVQRIDC